MSTTALDLTTVLKRRVRDLLFTAHTASDIRFVLSEAQRIVNARTRAVLGSVTYEVPAESRYLAHDPTSSTLLRVDHIRAAGRDLPRVDLHSLTGVDSRWPSSLGSRLKAWARVGHDLLIFYPAPLLATSVELRGPLYTNELTSDTSVLQVPDSLRGGILDIAEALLLVRQRLFRSAEPAAAHAVEVQNNRVI